MAEMYKHIKSGIKAEFVEFSKDGNMVTLKKEGGGFTAPTKTNFEKYWRKIEDKTSGKKAEKKSEAKKSVVTPAEEAVTSAEEKIATEKKSKKAEAKSVKAEKPKKEKNVKVSDKSEAERLDIRDKFVKDLKSQNVEVRMPEKYPMWLDIKIGEKNAFGIGFNLSYVRVRSMTELLPKSWKCKEIKGALNAGTRIEYEALPELVKVISDANKNYKDSDLFKRKKTEKKKVGKKKEEKKNGKN